MLSTEELDAVLQKNKLELSDLLLLEDHLLYILNVFNEHESLPDDVFLSLERDVDLILKRLKKENKTLFVVN